MFTTHIHQTIADLLVYWP